MSRYLEWGTNMFQKSRFYHKLLFRISVCFLLLCMVTILVVTYFLEMQVQQNMEKRIREELLRVQENGELYVRQILTLHERQLDKDGFARYQEEIMEQLSEAGYRETALYDTKGALLGSTSKESFVQNENREDFKLANQRKSAFTLHYGQQNQCDVYFSMPVEISGEKLGIICYYLDYSEVYGREWNTCRDMIRVVILLFLLIYLIIWLMVRRMINPVRKMTAASRDISEHFEDGQFDIHSFSRLKYGKRRDEIGELARNYDHLLHVTKEQFCKLQEDREHILSLMNNRQEFYNSITHELKTPLAVISGYAQLVRENGLLDSELFNNGTAQILQESNRLHRMVVQLLEMQDKGEETAFASFDAVPVLKDVMDMMRLKAERYGNELVSEWEEGQYVIVAKEDRIRQVFINLIDNAIKYGEAGEKIRIGIGQEKEEIKISVSNVGKGIKECEQEKIFEPFFRADKERSREMGSAGLGLSISKKIMEEHHGRIEVMSEPGETTVFSLFFPVCGHITDGSEDKK